MGNTEISGRTMEDYARRLMSEHGDSILRLCFVYLRDLDLAEDAMQETFVKACRFRDTFQSGSSERTWLTRIAINTCKDFGRSSWFRIVDRRIRLDDLPEPQTPPLEADDTLIVGVMKLPTKYREVILLCYYSNLSAREAAQTLRIALPTVYSRIKKAQAILKTELEGWYHNE
ncbi:MAG: sigma-70 family RNA polymerase sigma factor [Clostridiales bacterium]|nr:sigma-70 family RNA polymerase sigma factor [Clostridiales bacterium]